MTIFRFFKMAAVRHLGLVGSLVWTTLEEYLAIVSIFYAFGLKTPIHGPKIGFFWAFDPVNGERCHRHPKKALPWAETRHEVYIVESVHPCGLVAKRRIK